MPYWLSGPWTWIVPLLIFIGIPLLAALVIMRRDVRKVALEEAEETTPEVEPETAQEQTAISSTSGRLIDPEAAQMIGNPLVRWGKPERRRYIEKEYDGSIACLVCGRALISGQFFWETPLIDRETGLDTGVSFQLCLSCQPGDIAAVTNHGA